MKNFIMLTGLAFSLVLFVNAKVVQADNLRVYDGDTFLLNGERIRLLDVDTPELFSPKCEAEKRLARIARLRLKALLGDGTKLDIQRSPDKDRFGRTLATVFVEGRNVANTLINEGVAVKWEGHRHAWCCM